LGDRYDTKLNFKLPIAQRFSDIAKDDYFKQRFNKVIDKWLTEKSWGKLEQNIHIGEIESILNELQNKVKKWTLNLNFMPDNAVDVSWIYNTIETLEENIGNKIQDLYTQREQEELKNVTTKKDYSYKIPFENEIARLREMNSQNYSFTRNLTNHINVQLVNNPFLIIKGEAGSGKSHLLGDIANERILKNLPTIFLLGQEFHHTFSIEKNVLNQLGLNCTFIELLNTLNSIGKQVDSRFLILIDAINESIGTDFWIKQLDGFISQFKQYPFIGLTITIRDSYFNNLIPQSIKDNSFVTVKTHQGFKGNEYEALKLFCDFYGLEQPKFPILAPEFTNPLFLKLICKGVSNSSEKVFPSGFQGINKIFNYYIQSLNKIFLAKNDYRLRSSLVRDVVQKVALYLFKNSKRQFKIGEALDFFDSEYKMFPALLHDLIQEGIFIKNLRWNYHIEEDEEVLYFTYERFGDFYIGKELLKKFDSPNNIEISFQKGKDLGLLVNDYKNKGIIEALSVLLPEEYNLEIFEVFKWLFIEEDSMTDSANYQIGGESLNYILLDSFKWRATKSVDNEKITDWFNSQYFSVNDDNFWFVLLESTTIENHPLNSDRLFRILSRCPLANRDGFWQEHMKSFNGFDDENNGLKSPFGPKIK
jgi:DNA replication protein DnaC